MTPSQIYYLTFEKTGCIHKAVTAFLDLEKQLSLANQKSIGYQKIRG
jgi:hypothetical protein